MPDRIVDLYERTAAEWIAARGTRLIEQTFLDRFTAGLAGGATILDLGCGGGAPIAAELLARGFSVTGVDSAASLIAHASALLPASEWIVGDMRGITIERDFDAVIAWHSFFHLSPADQRTMFPRFAGWTKAGAPLIFTSGSEEGTAIGTWQGEPLCHASLSGEEYRALLDANGFDVAHYWAGDSIGISPTVWLARRRG